MVCMHVLNIEIMYLCAGSMYTPLDSGELSAGDAVRVELDPDVFKVTQQGHGGWNDGMAEVCVYVCA